MMGTRARGVAARAVLAAVAASVAAAAVVAGCGGEDTRTVDPTSTTSAQSVPSSVPTADSYEGVVRTLTKMGIPEDQARCVVEKLEQVPRGSNAPTGTDKSQIEKLLEECKVIG